MKNLGYDPITSSFIFKPEDVKKWCLWIFEDHTNGVHWFPCIVIKDYPGFMAVNMGMTGTLETARGGIAQLNRAINVTPEEAEEIVKSAEAVSIKMQSDLLDKNAKKEMN